MNARHIVPLIVVVVASTGALLSTASHPENSQPAHHHEAATQTHTAHHQELDHHDDVAVEDMVHHAATHLGTAAAIPESYVAVPDWKPSWELRWMDFHNGDHTVRLYHATEHDHPETRFVIAVDDASHDAVEHWTPAQ
jgi:hypothetical protein